MSAGFIRPERLSDSGASDDITMDSTAFSLHYRSLARSDSGDLKTPTKFGATPTSGGRSGSSPGSFMELTDREKKPFEVAAAAVAASGGGDSDDMSIEGEHRNSYDYGKLSPRLVAILAQGTSDLHAKATHSPIANYTSAPLNLECSVTSPAHQPPHDTTVVAASESSTKVRNILGH